MQSSPHQYSPEITNGSGNISGNLFSQPHFFTAELLLNFVFGFVQLNLHTANQPNSKLVKQGLRFPKIKPPPLSPIEYFIRARMELD